jgi:hypothetical protein
MDGDTYIESTCPECGCFGLLILEHCERLSETSTIEFETVCPSCECEYSFEAGLVSTNKRVLKAGLVSADNRILKTDKNYVIFKASA